MADPRTSFAILEELATSLGVPLHVLLEGDAVASKNALGAFVAKTAGTNLAAYLKVDPSTGALLTSSEAATDCHNAKGELAAGSATMVAVTGAEITLTPDTDYQHVGFVVSCRRDALFQIIKSDNAVETVLGEIVVGAGAYTISSQLHCLSFTTGSTGTQKLLVKAKNFEALSSFRASIVVEEVL